MFILFYSKYSDFQWKNFTDSECWFSENYFAKNRKSRAFNLIQMFEQIITHFVSSFTECIWIKTFLYSITFVVLSTFCLSLLQVHFSASMLHLFSELWWKKTITRKSLNWIITLLWNYYKKAEEKLIIALNENENEMIYRNNSSKVFWDILYI